MLELDLSFGVGSGSGEPTQFHFANTSEGESVVIDLVGIDTGLSGSIVASSVAITASPINGNVSFSAATGEFSYTPNSGISGSDAFRFTVENSAGDVSVSIKVTVAIARSALVIETVSSDDLSLGRDISPSSVDMEFGTTGTVALDLGRSINRVSTLGNADLRLGQGEAPVVQTVWTPERDQNGDITEASWRSIPVATKDNFFAMLVDGLDPVQQITDDLVAKGFNPAIGQQGGGTAPVQGTFTAWVGQAYDPALKKAWVPWGGGHFDSSLNGIWEFDVRKMKWSVLELPSDPYDAQHPWSSNYFPNPSTGSFTQYTDDDGNNGHILPDGRAPSMHTYNYVAKVGDVIFTLRNKRFAYNVKTKEFSAQDWTYKRQPFQPTVNGYVFPYGDHLYGSIKGANDSYGFEKIENAATSTEVLDVPGVPSGLYFQGGHFVTRISSHELCAVNENNKFSIFDMATETWGPLKEVTGNAPKYDYTQENQVNLYMPEWGNQGSILRQFTWSSLNGRWFVIDLETGIQEELIPTGYPQERGKWTGNKAFTVEMFDMLFFINPSVDEGVSETYITRLK